jgi:hypothetical protein
MQAWARLQWFREIAREYSDISTIHYMCFPKNTYHQIYDDHNTDYYDLLPGMVFTTPLKFITMGEMTAAELKRQKQTMDSDGKKNHMTDHNNMILGEHTLNAIENYTPGKFEIDLSKFQLVNPNVCD